MNCLCGRNLGPITSSTKGRCKGCGRSLWLQAAQARLEFTCSQAAHIAAQLTRKRAHTCTHGKQPCISQCGVRANEALVWSPIPIEERRKWFCSALQTNTKES